MIILSATTHSIKVVLAGSITTNQLPITASYVDLPAYTPLAATTATNNTTAVNGVAAPAGSTQRQVKGLTVSNTDTAAATVTVSFDDNGTLRRLARATLAVNETLEFVDCAGWHVLAADGSIKGVGTPGSNGSNGASGHLLEGVNAQTGTSYTLVLGDAGDMVTLDNGSAITLTVPANSTVAYPIGSVVYLMQLGAGQVTVAAAGGVTLRTASTLLLRAQYSTAALVKIATDTWAVTGDLEPV